MEKINFLSCTDFTGDIQRMNYSSYFYKFLSQYDTVRKHLGTQHDLLDTFVSNVLNAFHELEVVHTFARGTRAVVDFDKLYSAVISGNTDDDIMNHPLYEEFNKLTDVYELGFLDEESAKSTYFVLLHTKYLNYAIPRFTKECIEKIHSIINTNHKKIYSEIRKILKPNSHLFDELLTSIYYKFYAESKIKIFVQTFNDELITHLLKKDSHSDKYVFAITSEEIKL